MKSTLFKYIFKMQIKSILLISLFLFGLIVVFDFAEVSRRMPISNWNEFILDVKISWFGAFSTFEAIAHYIFFITATFNLWHLSNSQQMIILKSAGQSPWQILYPFFTCAALCASLWLFVLQPYGIYGDQHCRELQGNNVIESNENIWLDYKNDGLLFIKKIQQNKAKDVCYFDQLNNAKIIAENAEIKKSDLVIYNGSKIQDGSATTFNELTIKNIMDNQLLKIISKPSNKQSIYSLYAVYCAESARGISLKKYEIALQRLLANVFTFILFALIAAVICFPLNRYKSKSDIVIQVIGIAIIMRFLNSIFDTMAYSGALSAFMAEWCVVLFAFLVSTAVLVWREV